MRLTELPPLVGRLAEVAIIGEEIAAARDGRLRVVTIEGEAGIGKTRLLREVGRLAAAQQILVLEATADEDLRGPYLVVRMLLSGAATTPVVGEGDAQLAIGRAERALRGEDRPPVPGDSPEAATWVADR